MKQFFNVILDKHDWWKKKSVNLGKDTWNYQAYCSRWNRQNNQVPFPTNTTTTQSPPLSPWQCALINMQTACGHVQLVQLMALGPASSSGTFWSVTGWQQQPSPSRGHPYRCRSHQEGHPSWMDLWIVFIFLLFYFIIFSHTW